MDKKYFRPCTASETSESQRTGIPSKSSNKRPGTALGVSTDLESRRTSIRISVSFTLFSDEFYCLELCYMLGSLVIYVVWRTKC